MRTLTHTHTHVLSLTLPSLPSGIHRSSLDGKRYMSSSKLCCVRVVKSASMISDACHNICMLCAYRCSQSENRPLPQILFGWVVFFDADVWIAHCLFSDDTRYAGMLWCYSLDWTVIYIFIYIFNALYMNHLMAQSCHRSYSNCVTQSNRKWSSSQCLKKSF